MEYNQLEIPITPGLDVVFQEEIVKQIDGLGETVCSVKLSPDHKKVVLQVPAHMAEAEIQEIETLVQVLDRTYSQCERKVLYHRTGKSAVYEDPHPALLKEGGVFSVGEGILGYGGDFLRLVLALDRYFLDRMKSFSPDWIEPPSMTSVEILNRCGYFENFPQHCFCVSSLRSGLADLRGFRERIRGKKSEAIKNEIKHFSSGPKYVLPPALCHFYLASLEGKVIGSRDRFLSTILGNCFRQERQGGLTLKRLQQFRVRELVYVGSVEKTRDYRDEMQKWVIDLAKELQVNSSYESAFDPFFVDLHSRFVPFQVGQHAKYELRAELPYDSSTIAVASVNFHGSHFTKAFGITLSDGSPAVSCCLGLGLERWALVLLSQFGLKPKGWPKAIRSFFEMTK